MKKRLQILTWIFLVNKAHGQYNLPKPPGSPEEEGSTMTSMLADLYSRGFYKSKVVENAMMLVDRKLFCSCPASQAYNDKPFPITYGSFIAAPSFHATALQLMKRHLKPDGRALDIGCGSGYLTAAMGVMMGRGLVVGIDHMKAVLHMAYDNIRMSNPGLLNNVVYLYALDGRMGYQPMAPYDVIHCGASAEKIPDVFMKQLKPGGRLVMSIGKSGHSQQLVTADLQQDGSWKIVNVTDVYVMPLSDPLTQIVASNKTPQVGRERIDQHGDYHYEEHYDEEP